MNFSYRLCKFPSNNGNEITLVPEAFFYSFLANFATRTASFSYLFTAMKRWEARKESLFFFLSARRFDQRLASQISKWKKK